MWGWTTEPGLRCKGLVRGLLMHHIWGQERGLRRVVGVPVGPGGLTITELLSLRLSGWPSALSPTLSSGCRARTWGEELEHSKASSLRLFTSLPPPPSS